MTAQPDKNGRVSSELFEAELQRLQSVVDERDRLYDERDRRYEDRFKGAEDKVALALSAQKELNNVVQAAADRAILKSEEAQRAYNERSNEFRQSLDDQNKTQLPRTEADSRFNAVNSKIDDRFKTLDNKIEDLKSGRTKQGNFEVSTVISLLAIALSLTAVLVMIFKH
jgi:hypothetical protein